MSSRNTTALERTLRAMKTAGRLEGVDAALVALARTSAASLDAAELGSSSSSMLTRSHAMVLERLANVGKHDEDRLDRMLGSLAVPPTVGDTTDF